MVSSGTESSGRDASERKRTKPVARPRQSFHPVAGLSKAEWDQLFSIAALWMTESREAFEQTSRRHAEIVRYKRPDGSLVGFTLLSTYPVAHAGRDHIVIFTSDVYLDPSARRQNLVQITGFRAFLRARARHPFKPIYWVFDAGSHLSYLSATRNFAHYWPSARVAMTPDQHGFRIAAVDALYGPGHVRQDGIVDTPTCVWQPGVIVIPDALKDDPDVLYFLTINPQWAAGHSVICVCPLTVSNMLSLARTALRRKRRHERTPAVTG